MNDPVDTDALRTWAAARADNKLLPLVLAAADEVDRLRKDLGTQQRVNADLVRAWDYEYDKVNRLRAVIENAPHAATCGVVWRLRSTRDCTCWKADAA